jgi:hypothetical protein
MSAAPKGRNILAQGAALGREGPSPRLPFDLAHGSTLLTVPERSRREGG